MLELTCNLPFIKAMAIACYKNKGTYSIPRSYQFTWSYHDIWQNAQLAGHNKIGSLIKKDVNF